MSTTPILGTKCVDCGCCLATILAAGDPICWECDEGKPCKGKQASAAKKETRADSGVNKGASGLPDPIAKLAPEPPKPQPGAQSGSTSPKRDPKPQPQPAQPLKEQAMPKSNLTVAQMQAIRSAPADLSTNELATKFNTTWYVVDKLRKEGKPKTASVTPPPRNSRAKTTEPAGEVAKLEFEVTAELLDAFWSRRSLSEKAAYFEFFVAQM